MPDQVQVSERAPRAFKTGDAASDIFAMVKESMSSKTLSQSPLLVWPAAMQGQSQKALETANGHTCPTKGCELDPTRREELRLLQSNMRRDFPHMSRTVRWYQTMVDGVHDESCRGVPDLSFLRDARATHFDWTQIRLGSDVPPPKPHELQVVFHRGNL